MNKPWTITIDDGYGAYSYELSLGSEVSIYDVAQTIADTYEVPLPEGKFVRVTKESQEPILL